MKVVLACALELGFAPENFLSVLFCSVQRIMQAAIMNSNNSKSVSKGLSHSWRRGNTFASQRCNSWSSPGYCSLGSTQCHMWDIFHPSQPMPGGFP